MTEENVIYHHTHIPVHLYSQYDIKSKGVKCDNLYLYYLYLLPRLVVLAVGKVCNHSFHIKALFKQSYRTYLTFSIPLKFQQTHPDTSILPRPENTPDNTRRVSPFETTRMNCQSLFPRGNLNKYHKSVVC